MWMNPTTTYAVHNNSNVSPQQSYTNSLYSSRRASLSKTPAASAFASNTTDSDPYLDIDSEIKSQASTSSSPQSTAGSFPLSSFDTLPPSTIPRTFQSGSFKFSTPATQSQFLPAVTNMMYTDTWSGDLNQFAPKNNGRIAAHNRDSSLSSLGSLGPPSPFTFHSSNPQIAVNDTSDYQGLPMHDDNSFQLAAKAPNATSHDTFYANYPYSDNTSVQAYASMLAPQKHRGDRATGGLLPPPDFSNGASRPGSVASSVASDSPATPSAPEPSETEEDRRRKPGKDFFLADILNLDIPPDLHPFYDAGMTVVPKLDRTMTDIFSDELYNPNFHFTSAPPSQPSQSVASPTNEMFAQRLQAANNQHLTATTTQAPTAAIQRGRSPFRNGSPLAPKPSHDFSPQVSTNVHFNTAQHARERRKQEETAQALRQITQTNSTGTPQTISPKDAVLEFNDDDANNFPLFPQHQSSGFDANDIPKVTNQATNFNNLALDTNFDNFLSSQLSASQLSNGVPLPQQYPFVAKHRQQPSLPSAASFSMSSRMESSGSPSSIASASPQRPDHVGADGGTYTCTYHGCTQRFETPALLQKHKREGHRQAHGLNSLRRPEVSPMGGTFLNTQAGPHKCERINPSTGKPCNTIFSRPYDLTRHEDTIHNGRKQKVRCDVCTEEKTFSRADALTRHYRVCHPDLEFPGKHRKRGGPTN